MIEVTVEPPNIHVVANISHGPYGVLGHNVKLPFRFRIALHASRSVLLSSKISHTKIKDGGTSRPRNSIHVFKYVKSVTVYLLQLKITCAVMPSDGW